MSSENYEHEWAAAEAYNQKLAGSAVAFEPNAE